VANFIITFLLLIIPLSAWADDFYSQHESGWYWFDDPKTAHAEKNIPQDHSKESDSSEQVLLARQKLKKALDQAIIDPTPQNVKINIELENQLAEKANQYANMKQQVLHDNPELNYSIKHPTNNVAIQVYNEAESQKKLNVINDFSKHFGLFFFYRSTCPYCKRFAPILKHFSETYHIAVIPITTDGISLPEFPNSKIDNGQSKQFQVSVEPALYAVDPQSQKAFPVAFGLTSESELLDNIYNVYTHYKSGLS